MAYCNNCGVKVPDEAKFCQNCGHELRYGNNESIEQGQQKFDGIIYKCPNCGEQLKAFITVCPSCGYEIRGTKNQSSIKEFTRQLEEIEDLPYFKGLFSAETKSRKASFIKNYPVPNTREDMLEFMILAVSSINYDDLDDSGEKKAVAAAWKAKIEQVYEKAKSSYGNETDFVRIEEMYQKYKKAIKHKNLKYFAIIGGCILLFILMGVILHYLPQL